MTENNAAQPGLTDTEKDAIYHAWQDRRDEASYGDLIDAVESALLSKLRAEGVQAGDLPTMQSAFRITEQHGDPAPAKRQYLMVFKFRSAEDMNAADDEWRAALASAPVAGEAISDKRLLLMMARWHLQMLNPDDLLDVTEFGRAAYAAGLADAAPQASEAVPVGIINAARYAGFTFLRHADGSYTLQPIVMATAQADKDGGDCAKGADQPDIETLRRVGAAHDAVQVCPECDIAGCKHIRAALAAQHPRTDGGGYGS